MDLEKIREAAERVAGSEGLEIFDIEWKVGKQRLLRVYIDRLPGPANPEGLGASPIRIAQRVSEQLTRDIRTSRIWSPGPAYILEVSSARLGSKEIDKGGRLRAVRGPQGEKSG